MQRIQRLVQQQIHTFPQHFLCWHWVPGHCDTSLLEQSSFNFQQHNTVLLATKVNHELQIFFYSHARKALHAHEKRLCFYFCSPLRVQKLHDISALFCNLYPSFFWHELREKENSRQEKGLPKLFLTVVKNKIELFLLISLHCFLWNWKSLLIFLLFLLLNHLTNNKELRLGLFYSHSSK